YGRKARATQTAPTATTRQRMGFVAALRSSYQVADIRGDLRVLPELLRGRSFLLPAGLSVASVVVALVTVSSPNAITALVVTLFVGPLPIASVADGGGPPRP